MADQFDYAKTRATVERLLKKFGAAGTVYERAETGGTDALGNALPDTTGKAIAGFITPLLPYSTSTQLTTYERDNVKAGDMYAYFHSEELVDINMLVDANGSTWRVQSIKSLTSNSGVNVFQKLMLRK
ncbi:head-closure protein [Vibrio phage 137E35-1]|nr:head-closure protein [Vibrio phage 137E35-1]CAH9015525.1 head-closure protein [Vibrio phage 230E39-1]